MLSCEQTLTEQMMVMDMSHENSRDQFQKITCRTRVLVDDFHLCLVHRYDCEFAHSFGMNHMCNSLKRHEYSR